MTALTDFFKRGERPSEYDRDSMIWTLTDDAPEWLTDAVREAHDGELPDDWRYETCRRICSELDERETFDVDESNEIADTVTDIYNADLLRWLGGYLTRAEYCDRAAAEYGAPSDCLFTQIRTGQYLCIEEMVRVLIEAVAEHRCSRCAGWLTDDGESYGELCPTCADETEPTDDTDEVQS